MNYLRKNESGLKTTNSKPNIFHRTFDRPRHPTFLKIIFVILFFLLLLILNFLFPKTLRNIFSATARPVWTVGRTIGSGAGSLGQFFSSKSSLTAEVNSLQNQIVSLELKQVDYDTISQENQDLKNSFGRNVGNIASNRLLANVLSKPPQSPYDTFVLDVGSENGVAVGDKVYISDTILVGEVSDVTGKTSVVSLFSKGGMQNFLTDERTGTTYEIVGQGGADMLVEVPKDADIMWGDVFSYPNIKTSVIGSVFYIDQSAQSSFKTIFIRIPGNVFQTKWVFVQK